MAALPCPVWDYETHPDHLALLPRRCQALRKRLARKAIDVRAVAEDCRSIHLELFTGLTPFGFDYFAGHYRGERYPCLFAYAVEVAGDPTVGVPPEDAHGSDAVSSAGFIFAGASRC